MLLTDQLSTPIQRDLVLHPGLNREQVVAILRLEVLLYGSLLLPDSYIFDGSIFVDLLPPESFMDALACTPDRRTVLPRFRQPSFEASLHEFISDPAAGTYRPIEYRSILDTPTEEAVAERLGAERLPTSQTDSVQAFRAVALDVGFPEDRLHALIDSWQRWSSHVGSDVDVWPQHPAPLDEVVERSPLTETTFLTKRGFQVYRRVRRLVLTDRDWRSASTDAILRESTTTDARTHHDLELIRAWYAEARLIALATQHNSALASVPPSRPDDWPDRRDNRRTPPVVEHLRGASGSDADSVAQIVETLSHMSGPEFADLYDRTRTKRAEWMSTRDSTALRGLCHLIYTHSAPDTRTRPQLRDVFQHAIIPAGALLTAQLADYSAAASAVTGAVVLGAQEGAIPLRDFLQTRTFSNSIARWALTREAS